MTNDKRMRRDQPTNYRICLKGLLDPRWASMLGGMVLSWEQFEDGSNVTILSGQLIDQAALMGVLNLVYDLGLPVIFVECDEASLVARTSCHRSTSD